MGTIRRIDPQFTGGMRNDRLDNDMVCMATAVLWAARSKDPSSQVGAVFVNEEGRVISIGYNGAPNEWDDKEFPWDRNTKQGLNNTKYPYVVHAEMNGILNHMGAGSDFKDSTLFVTLFPCSACAKFLVQRGIKKVIYLSDKYCLTGEEFDEKYDNDDNIASKRTLTECGVTFIPYELINEKHASLLKISLEPDKGVNMVRKRKK